MTKVNELLACALVLSCLACANGDGTGTNESIYLSGGAGATGNGGMESPGVRAGVGGGGNSGAAGVVVMAGGMGAPAVDASVEAGASAADAAIEPVPDAAALPEPHDESCLTDITDYKAPGPFTYEAVVWDSIKAWVPNVPAGCRVPMMHFANDTGGTCSVSKAMLEHVASHGFLALCYENTNTAASPLCIDAVDRAYEEVPDLVSHKLAFSGYGSGGQAALLCAYYAQDKWGRSKSLVVHAFAPESGNGAAPISWSDAYGQIDSPVFMFNGTADGLVSAQWVGDGFHALSPEIEAYWYEGIGATHVPVPAAWLNESAVTWMRWKLLGDVAACEHWKAMPDGEDWDLREQQHPSPCE